jgi:protoporphyrinogen IX oxidase
MPFIKAFHIIFMVCWFAGIFYLPRLFVYHAMATDLISLERFKIMERRLLYGIMTPSAFLTIFFGVWLMHFNLDYYTQAKWFQFKMMGVATLIGYHSYCAWLYHCFKRDKNQHTALFYRILNELPVVLLIAIVLLVCVKP